MNRFLNRRHACCGIFASTLTGSLLMDKNAHATTLPICSFSLQEGWGAKASAGYVTRRAKANDSSGIPQVVQKIKSKLSINAPIDIYLAEQENNAYAAVANGRKILVFDVDFLEKLDRMARTRWSAIQVIAHEVGHHIAGFNANRHRSELNADYWSGQSLQRLGAAKEAATSAILTVGTEIDTSTHPNKRKRAATIARGWDDAARDYIDYSFCDDCR